MPEKCWAEAVNTAAYLHNVTYSKVIGKTPYEAWTGSKPSLGHLKVFGAKVYAYVPKQKHGELDPRPELGIFVGYNPHNKGFRDMDPKTLEVDIKHVVYVDESCC